MTASAAVAAASAHFDVRIADVDVRLRAPQDVLRIVGQTLAYEAAAHHDPPLAEINVHARDGSWVIGGTCERSRKVLGGASRLPQVGGAVVSALIAEVADRAGLSAWRASVLECEGDALVLAGDDWESCITLTAHLHTRGWRLLGGDRALVDVSAMTARAFRKMLYVNSSSLDGLPLLYRRAVEASPWYSTHHHIAFYAIDPALATGSPPWAKEGRMRGLLRVDGDMSEHPAIEPSGDAPVLEHYRARDFARGGVRAARLRLGEFAETCDLIERWFRPSLAASAAR